VREGFEQDLRCPYCRAQRSLTLNARERDEREVRAGTMTCGACGARVEVRDGIVHAMVDPPEHVLREAAGLDRFEERMRDDAWTDEMILSLPYRDDGYWYAQARSMHQLLTSVHFEPGDRVLDVGSNTCWASSHLAERGLEVVALDISTAGWQGLGTGDLFIRNKGVYFERVLATMFDLPFADGTFDYVYCAQVLHHNDRQTLRRTMEELHRILKRPGGLLVVNEPLRTAFDLRGNHPDQFDVEEFEGYEHAFTAAGYLRAALAAGFAEVRILEPHYRSFFGDTHLELPPGTSATRALGEAIAYGLRPRRWARRAYLAYVTAVAPRSSISFTAWKPHRQLPIAKRLRLRARAVVRGR